MAPVRMGDETHLASEDDALLEKQKLLQSSVPCWQCWFCLHLCCNCTFAHLVLASAAHFGLVWLLGFFFVFWSSLSTLMRDFVSGGCAWECSWWSKGFACDNPYCTWCAVVVFFTSRETGEKNKYRIFVHLTQSSHLVCYLYSEFEGVLDEWWLLNMPSEFQLRAKFKLCLNFPAITVAVLPTISALLCSQTNLLSVCQVCAACPVSPIWQEMFSKNRFCTTVVF